MAKALTQANKQLLRDDPPRLPLSVVLAGLVGAAWMIGAASRVTLPLPPSAGSAGGAAETILTAPPTHGTGHPPELILAGGDSAAPKGVVGERLRLLDPAPLFLPLRAGAEGFARNREPRLAEPTGKAGEPFPALLRFGAGADLRALLRPVATTELTTVAGILLAPRWFNGLARVNPPGGTGAVSPAPAPPVGTATVGASKPALRLRVFRLGVKIPESSVAWGGPGEIGSELWKPLVLIVLVDANSRCFTPSITSGSGIDEVDEKIRWIVGHELLPTLRLRPGMYRLEVGP